QAPGPDRATRADRLGGVDLPTEVRAASVRKEAFGIDGRAGRELPPVRVRDCLQQHAHLATLAVADRRLIHTASTHIEQAVTPTSGQDLITSQSAWTFGRRTVPDRDTDCWPKRLDLRSALLLVKAPGPSVGAPSLIVIRIAGQSAWTFGRHSY